MDALTDFLLGSAISEEDEAERGAEGRGAGMRANLAQQIVETEQLPIRLLRILDDNMASVAPTMGAAMDLDDHLDMQLLRSVVRCIQAYAEHSLSCALLAAYMGFRSRIVQLLLSLASSPSSSSGWPSVLLGPCLAALATLCGHGLPLSPPLGAQGAFSSGSSSTSSVVARLGFSGPQEREGAIAELFRALERAGSMDAHAVIHIFTALRCILQLDHITLTSDPTAPSSSLLYAPDAPLCHRILDAALGVYASPIWNLDSNSSSSSSSSSSSEVVRYAYVSINTCINEVVVLCPSLHLRLWRDPGFLGRMRRQLSRATAAGVSPATASDIAEGANSPPPPPSLMTTSYLRMVCSCLALISAAIDEVQKQESSQAAVSTPQVLAREQQQLLLLPLLVESPGFIDLLRRIGSLAALPEVNAFVVDFFAHMLFTTAAGGGGRHSLFPLLVQCDAIGSLFAVLARFKAHSGALTALYGISVGPQYHTITSLCAVQALLSFLEVDGGQLQHVRLVTADEVEAVIQLHDLVCSELRSGRLRVHTDLEQLMAACSQLLDSIRRLYLDRLPGHPESTYIAQLVSQAAASWQSSLVNAAQAGIRGAMLYTGPSSGEAALGLGPSSGTGADEGGAHMEVVEEELEAVLLEGLMPGELPVPIMLSGIDCILPVEEIGGTDGREGMQRAVVEVALPSCVLRMAPRCELARLEGVCSVLYSINARVFSAQRIADGSHLPITSQEQFMDVIRAYEHAHPGREDALRLYVGPSAASLFMSDQLGPPITVAPARSMSDSDAIRSLQREAEMQRLRLDKGLVEDVFDYCRNLGATELTIDQVVRMLTEVLHFSAPSAHAIAHGFDASHRGVLSIREVVLGLTKIMSGNAEDRMRIAFDAYDANGDGYMELSELTSLIHDACGLPLDDLAAPCRDVLRLVDSDRDGRLHYADFKAAVLLHLVPLRGLWTEAAFRSDMNASRSEVARRHWLHLRQSHRRPHRLNAFYPFRQRVTTAKNTPWSFGGYDKDLHALSDQFPARDIQGTWR
jgi:Ca2+-binding EF-hand superfamily protein